MFSMSRYFKQSLKFSLAAAIALSLPLAQAQSYDGHQGWGAPPAADYGQGAYPWNPQAQQHSPADLLRGGVQQLTSYLDSKPNRRALAAYLDRVVAPWFDFDYMAEWAAGRRFQRMDEAQQDELAARIKGSFLDKMVQKLSRYSNQRVMFLPAESDGYDQISLSMAIENPDGYPSQLEFSMRQTGEGWKVVDVSANGMSALVYYRQMFNELMNQRPPQQRMAPQQQMRPPY
jgi:phospholipid transport system substrate-binding protein